MWSVTSREGRQGCFLSTGLGWLICNLEKEGGLGTADRVRSNSASLNSLFMQVSINTTDISDTAVSLGTPCGLELSIGGSRMVQGNSSRVYDLFSSWKVLILIYWCKMSQNNITGSRTARSESLQKNRLGYLVGCVVWREKVPTSSFFFFLTNLRSIY